MSDALPTSVDDLFDTILGQIPGDWQVERGTDSSGTRWISLTRSFSDLEELKQIMSEGTISKIAPMDEFYITQDDGFFGTKTEFSTSLDPGNIMSGAQEESSGLPADLLEKVLSIQYRLTLPGEIGDNNADTRDGNTLVWNVGFSGKTDMYAESSVVNWGAIIGVIVGGVIVVALIVLGVVLLLRRRRRKSPPSQPEVAEGEGTAAQPGAEPTAEPVAQPDTAEPVAQSETAVPATQSETTQTTAPAAAGVGADTTEIRRQTELVPPPADDSPPTLTATAVTGAAAAGATAAAVEDEPSSDEAAPLGAPLEETAPAGSPAPAIAELPGAAEPPAVEPARTREELPAADTPTRADRAARRRDGGSRTLRADGDRGDRSSRADRHQAAHADPTEAFAYLVRGHRRRSS